MQVALGQSMMVCAAAEVMNRRSKQIWKFSQAYALKKLMAKLRCECWLPVEHVHYRVGCGTVCDSRLCTVLLNVYVLVFMSLQFSMFVYLVYCLCQCFSVFCIMVVWWSFF